MGRRSLPPGGGLLMVPGGSIHTFFMRFPIDVLYLDRDWRVLRATPAVQPWRVGPLYTRGCHAVLELPPGTIAASRSEIGDRLTVEPVG